jgi:hypothetical protein
MGPGQGRRGAGCQAGWSRTRSLLLKNHDKVQKREFFNAHYSFFSSKAPKSFEIKKKTIIDNILAPASVVDFWPQRNA